MKNLFLLVLVLIQFFATAQTTISGKVTDKKGEPIAGANIYLDGTYDGSSSNLEGNFSFTTNETHTQTLVISLITFETFTKIANVSELNNLDIKLREDVNSLDAVMLNAGTFKAGDNAKVTALKPLDVVTTASALGDFVGALQTLPGTSTVAEDGRLFVRGGDADETQIFIDGIRVFTPYTPTTNNLPTRGRFSPFLFKGITFSTGGYSAEYGQALSSVLELETIAKPTQEKTELSFMTVGLGAGNTQIWGKNSLSVNASYFNLKPYQELFPSRNKWLKSPQSASGEMVYRHEFKDNSLLKMYGAFSYADFKVIQEDINLTDGFKFGLKNRNLYINTSYKNVLNNNWVLSGGFSFVNDESNFDINDDKIKDTENSTHIKVKLKKNFSSRFKLNFGAEYFTTKFKEKFKGEEFGDSKSGFDNNIVGTFVETGIFFSKKLASKIGVRGEYSELLNEYNISPRLSLAYKSGKNAQFSLAYGQFYQNPKTEYLKFSKDFTSENTSHLIANYQYVKNKQIFRIEAYYKDYKDLVKYDTEFALPNSNFNNNGNAFAKGIDVFWRDNKSIKNFEYWTSYSYLDTERDYKNYPTSARPNFATNHNLSLVGKYWIEDWKSQVGFSYTFATGRTYTNPNQAGFLNAETKNYNSVSLNWAYLLDKQKILYFSINNVLGTKNINGYQYKNKPNLNGYFDRRAITPGTDSFFFIGFFWTISNDKTDNQLDNL
jgi:outer membrane cobalamin receptor